MTRQPWQKITWDDVKEWFLGLGWWRLAGCAALLACVVATVIICKRYQEQGSVWEYAEETARPIPAVALPIEVEQALAKRLTAFRNDLIQERLAGDLALSKDELNYLLQHYDGSGVTSNLYCDIRNGTLTALVSLPVGQGRYLNGEAVLSIYVTSGRICVFMEKVETMGRPLPENVMREIRMENLIESANRDPSLKRLFTSIQSIGVSGDQLIVRAKRRSDK